MTTRIALILLASFALARAHTLEDDAKPLSKEQLAELLGSRATTSMSWTKYRGPDFNIYYGHVKPPLSGSVSIYLGGFPPFQPDPSLPVVESKLGMYSVKWQKRVAADGSLHLEMVTALHSDYWKAHVQIEAKSQYDIDRMLEELSNFPMFTRMPEPVGAP